MSLRNSSRPLNDFVARWNMGEREFTGLPYYVEVSAVRLLREMGVSIVDGRKTDASAEKKRKAMKAAWADPARRKRLLAAKRGRARLIRKTSKTSKRSAK
jgi:hypothetical protein